MVQVSLCCPFCGTEHVRKKGHSNGKQRYLCKKRTVRIKHSMPHTPLPSLQPGSEKIHRSVVGGWCRHSGNFSEAQSQYGYRHRRIKKKETSLSFMNREYFERHSHLKIRIEMDEMWSFMVIKDTRYGFGGQ